MILPWRLEAAARLQAAPVLVELLQGGGLDVDQRSRAVLRLPRERLTGQRLADRTLGAVVRALEEGVHANAQLAAVELLTRGATEEHLPLLRRARPHLDRAADERLGAFLRTFVGQGVGPGQLSLAPVAAEQGAVSVAQAPEASDEVEERRRVGARQRPAQPERG